MRLLGLWSHLCPVNHMFSWKSEALLPCLQFQLGWTCLRVGSAEGLHGGTRGLEVCAQSQHHQYSSDSSHFTEKQSSWPGQSHWWGRLFCLEYPNNCSRTSYLPVFNSIWTQIAFISKFASPTEAAVDRQISFPLSNMLHVNGERNTQPLLHDFTEDIQFMDIEETSGQRASPLQFGTWEDQLSMWM